MKKAKILILIFTLISSTLIFDACENAENSEITESVLTKFMELTEIPRPSKHEGKVSDFLKLWAEEHNFEVVQDDANNIIVEVPATEGMENKPLVILQGHMDMVFAQADGLDLDPLTTKIEVVNDGKTLATDGNTSLGGDDGIGVSIMECVAEGMMNHGPLRLIITTDEELGQTGVKTLDKKYIEDADYIINLDDEKEGEIVISSASGVDFKFTDKLSQTKPTGDKWVKISFIGLTGGHSGDEIHRGRMNGIIALGGMLQNIKKNNIDFQIASISGGNAINAIPTGVKAELCISENDYEKLNDVCNTFAEKLKEKYSKTDPNFKLEISEIAESKQVVSTEDTDDILSFLLEKFDGVYTMSKEIDGLVESSSNLGIISVDSKSFMAEGMLRSSNIDKEKELIKMNRELASKIGYEIVQDSSSKAWPVKENNLLEKIAVKTYKELYSKDLDVVAIHAGLECGFFAEINPDANIISMGATLINPHSIKEYVEIESIEKVWKLLEGILAEV